MDSNDKKQNQFAQILKETKVNVLRPGQRVTAEVVEVNDDVILLDLHAQTEGRIYLNQYTNKEGVTSFHDLGIEVGSKVTAEVKKVQDDPALILLSRLGMVNEEHFEELEQALQTGERLTGVVSEVNKGGIILKYHKFNLFVPRSLLDHDLYNQKEELIGQKLEVVITEIKSRGRRTNIIASRKPIFEELRQKEYQERQELRQAELEKINTGDVLTGTVERLEVHAATVKFEHVRGLLRISQVSHHRINIEDELEVGQEVRVKVIKKEGNRLDLSIKALLPTPYEKFREEHGVGDEVSGVIRQKLPFGLRVEVARDVSGLLHKSEYSWNPNDNFDAGVKIGDEIKLKIISTDDKKERLTLSKKALEENPWKNVHLRVNDIVKVKVLEVGEGEEGLVVLAEGATGSIPFDELGLEKGAAKDYFAKDDEIEAVVIKVERKTWTLILSLKRVKEIAAKKEVKKHIENQKEEDIVQTIGDIVSESDVKE